MKITAQIPRTINCRGRLLDLSRPIVMGILNITPDSFYDGGAYLAPESAIQRIAQMLEEGATVVDIGAFSSRPGSRLVGPSEELDRLGPVLEGALKQFPEALFSIDTCRSQVAAIALEMGAHIINDITAATYDVDMAGKVAQFKAPLIAMHMQGSPETMQRDPQYENVVREVMLFLTGRIRALRSAGIMDVIIDPGFGFGKSVYHNFQLLSHLHAFQVLGCPVLAGISRKSMICRTLDVSPDRALNGSTALHMIALQEGAAILRVHDVREAVEVTQLYEQLVATI